MLKRILILMIFSLVFFSSCNKSDDNQTKRANAQRALIEKNAEERKDAEAKAKAEENKKDSKRLVYNINGVIFKKVYKDSRDEYIFYIELENGGLIEWETTGIKYDAKEVGSAVNFEYLRKDRYSDKAID